MFEEEVRITLMRCGGDRKKIEEEIARQEKSRALYADIAAYLLQANRDAEEALDAVAEADACLTALRARVR